MLRAHSNAKNRKRTQLSVETSNHLIESEAQDLILSFIHSAYTVGASRIPSLLKPPLQDKQARFFSKAQPLRT